MLGDHEMVGIPSKPQVCQEAAGFFEPCMTKRKRPITRATGIRITLPRSTSVPEKTSEARELQAKTAVALFFLGPRLESAYTF
jgi:hypothetical protein